MVKGGIRRISEHKCSDGATRRIEPVYFQETIPEKGRRFVRRAWFCGHCGYGDWRPIKKEGI